MNRKGVLVAIGDFNLDCHQKDGGYVGLDDKKKAIPTNSADSKRFMGVLIDPRHAKVESEQHVWALKRHFWDEKKNENKVFSDHHPIAVELKYKA